MSSKKNSTPSIILLGDVVKRRGFDNGVGIVLDKKDDWVRVEWSEGASRTHPKICSDKELRLLTPEEYEADQDAKFTNMVWHVQA